MARPQRNNVDYFPLYCDEGKKMYYIEETYGNDGFATFIKLLRELAKTDFHYLDLSKNTTMMFLAAKCKITKETLESIINDLVELEKFDQVLWSENKIIWCQDFIDSIQDAYNKRNNNCITLDGLKEHLISLGVRKPSKSKSKGDLNPQSKVKYTKENKRKQEVSTSDKFLYWFNSQKKELLGKEGKFKTLSKADLTNLEKIIALYDSEELIIAIRSMSKNKWVLDNNNFTPSHFLRIDNFNRYLNSGESDVKNERYSDYQIQQMRKEEMLEKARRGEI